MRHRVLDLLIRRIQSANQKNQTLVEASLGTLQGALRDLKTALQMAQTYGRDKRMGTAPEVSGVLRTQKA